MSIAALFFLVGLGQSPGSVASPNPDPAALVLQLGAPRFADRQAAAVALERLGAPALPALHAARESRDMEIKTRASHLLVKIETALLTQPTYVRLDFERVTLSELAQSLCRQTGFKIALYPQNLPRWKNQRVTLRRPQLLPFWRAIDELCDAASLQYNPNMQGFAGQQDQVFALTEGVARTLTPISDQGPFRVRLLSIDYQRKLSYQPAGGELALLPPTPRPVPRDAPARGAGRLARPNPVTTEQFTAQLVVIAEPRLSIAPRGELKLLEAVDDHGNSLAPPELRRQSLRYTNYFGRPHAAVIESHAQLKRPAIPGETIKKLRGTIPISVLARRPNPLIVSLEKSAGKTFQNSDVQLTIHDVRTLPDSRHTLIELSLRTDRPDSISSRDAEAYNSIFQRAQNQQLEIDVLDTRDHLMPWFQSSADVESSHVTITLANPVQTSAPKELRYYTVTRDEVDVPFDYADVPMP
jgi:hypothetical protein